MVAKSFILLRLHNNFVEVHKISVKRFLILLQPKLIFISICEGECEHNIVLNTQLAVVQLESRYIITVTLLPALT